MRLRHGYCITCDEVVTDDAGEVVELRVSHIPGSVGATPEGVKVSGVIHWVSAPESIPAEVRLYDRLFTVARPEDADGDFARNLNPDSLEVIEGARLEPSLASAEPGSRWQLERVGYFIVDTVDSRPGAPGAEPDRDAARLVGRPGRRTPPRPGRRRRKRGSRRRRRRAPVRRRRAVPSTGPRPAGVTRCWPSGSPPGRRPTACPRPTPTC